MYFVSPTYTGQYVRDDLSADNQCLLGNENINIIAWELGNESFPRQVATAQFQADILFHLKEIIAFNK